MDKVYYYLSSLYGDELHDFLLGVNGLNDANLFNVMFIVLVIISVGLIPGFYYKLWDSLQPKLVLTKDVKQVLSYVETGNADAGIVYRTDSRQSRDISVLAEIPSDGHRPIVYPLGVVKQTKHPSKARAFYRWLQEEEALSIFEKHGFKGVAANSTK